MKALPILALIAATGASPRDTAPLDITMQLVPATILLGEPVWVDVSVTNRSSEPVRVDMGNTCSGAKEIVVRIPAAAQVRAEHRPCDAIGAPAGCGVELPVEIAPGATLTRRYVMSGDFRIARAGNYSVQLEKNFPSGPNPPAVPAGTMPPFPRMTQAQMARETQTLTVLPADPAKLLHIEQQLAQRATAPMPNPPLPITADIEVIRRASDATRKAQYEASRAESSIAAGLMAYPASGMEPIFASWLAQNNSSAADWAVVALSHLNTVASREILARQAASTDKPTDTFFQIHRWEAVDALGHMGDTSYVPLLEKLTRDPYHDVQRMAVRNLGLLGGAKELPLLNQLARDGKTLFDRIDAIQAMGYTESLEAVPLLIQLFTLPDADQPNSSEDALWLLTHHRLADMRRLRTPLEAQRAWQEWWAQNRKTARAYGPYECATTL